MKKKNISYYSQEIRKVLDELNQDDILRTELTSWEINLLELAAHGFDNKRISQITYISPHTVKSHLATIYKKLQADNRAHAVYIAMKFNIIK